MTETRSGQFYILTGVLSRNIFIISLPRNYIIHMSLSFKVYFRLKICKRGIKNFSYPIRNRKKEVLQTERSLMTTLVVCTLLLSLNFLDLASIKWLTDQLGTHYFSNDTLDTINKCHPQSVTFNTLKHTKVTSSEKFTH